jgi:hypothetical protein
MKKQAPKRSDAHSRGWLCHTKKAGQPTLQDRLKNVIGKAKDMPPDASVNIDHYLYETPKRK